MLVTVTVYKNDDILDLEKKIAKMRKVWVENWLNNKEATDEISYRFITVCF